MLTTYIRDHAVTIAWFGLMAFVWFGWSQEDPGRTPRWLLGAGSVVGAAIAGWFGFLVARHWSTPSALDGRYHWFGVLVLVEVLAAGIGCIVLAARSRGRWMSWWVAVVVALHFIPLAWLLEDWSMVFLAAVQIAGLGWMVPRLRGRPWATSRVAGPWMGATLLAFAALSIVVYWI